MRDREWTRAIDLLNKAFDRQPPRALWYDHRGVAQAELGQMYKAYDDFKNALELDNSDMERWYRLAVAQLATGRNDEYHKARSRQRRSAIASKWPSALFTGLGSAERG